MNKNRQFLYSFGNKFKQPGFGCLVNNKLRTRKQQTQLMNEQVNKMAGPEQPKHIWAAH